MGLTFSRKFYKRIMPSEITVAIIPPPCTDPSRMALFSNGAAVAAEETTGAVTFVGTETEDGRVLLFVAVEMISNVVHVESLHDFVISVVSCIVVVEVPEFCVVCVLRTAELDSELGLGLVLKVETVEDSGQKVVNTVEIPDCTVVTVVIPVV